MKSSPQQAKIRKHHIHYLTFDSLNAFHGFMDTHRLKPSNRERWQGTKRSAQRHISSGSDWYGLPTPKSVEQLENHRDFIGMHLLDATRARLEKRMRGFMQYFEENEIPQRKIAYNSMGLGVFSFARASIGLHKVPKPDGGTKIVTSVKDVYAHFDRKDVADKTVKVFVAAGAPANIKGEQMLYVGIGMMLLVELFEKMGVGIEINVMLGSQDRNGTHYMTITKAKRLEDSLDKNLILLLCSDPRHFRFRGFQGIIAIYDYFGKTCPSGLGRSFDLSTSQDFVDSLNEKGKYNYLFQQSYSLEAVEKEVERILMDFKRKEATS